MSLTKLIEKMGFNPLDFAAEIASLEDRESESSQYCSYLNESIDPSPQYSYKGVFDVIIDKDGKKLFKFSYNKQHGTGPMSYWWEVAHLVEGVWIVSSRARYSYGCSHYPEKFPRA